MKHEIQKQIDSHKGRITNLILSLKRNKLLLDELKHYPSHWVFTRKLYHYLTNHSINYICPNCQNTELNFKGVKHGYSQFCSSKCSNSSKEIKNKREETCLKKYGHKHASQSKEFRNKVKDTCLNKYGVDNPMKTPGGQTALKDSLTKKYGVDNYSKTDEFKDKLYETRLKNGTIIPKEEKTLYALYYEEIINKTRKSYSKHFYDINPLNLKRSKNEYHLDHIYSISEGFKNNIDPEIIAHWTNLRMLKAEINMRKNSKCDKTKEQLIEDFTKSTLT